MIMAHISLNHITTAITGAFTAAQEFIYPPGCVLCQIELQSGSTLCDGCLEKMCPVEVNVCQRCGARIGPYSSQSDGCPLCAREDFAFDRVIRLGLYRDELRKACLMAKNPSGGLLGQLLADVLIETHHAEFAAYSFDAVVPVPEHWIKRIQRPQYAAETIARQLASRLKAKLSTSTLNKPKTTPKQARSSPTQRRQQQKGAFRISPQTQVNGQTILLVDDILTTGATADAAARVLKRSGAKQVIVAVIAVSPPTV